MQIRFAQLVFCWSLTAAAICAITPAQSQESDRGVTILDSVPAPPPPPPSLTPAPEVSSPGPAPSGDLSGGNSANPPLPDAGSPAMDAPKAAAVSPQSPTPEDEIAPSGNPTPEDEAELSQAVRKLPNAAGLSLQLMPSAEVQVGTRMSVRVLSRKLGYVILIDVDPTGRSTQIFPNPRSLLSSKASPQRANLLEPGKAITIPDSKNPFTGFELRAMPPSGRALLVALLSNRPVQVLDLPDIPSSVVGQAGALTYLQQMAQSLKVAQLNGGLEQIDWSFAAQFYSIHLSATEQ